MKGEYITKIGLGIYLVAIILLISWVAIYDGEHDILLDGKMKPETSSSKALLWSGMILSGLGLALCVIGYLRSAGSINYTIKA